MVPVFKNVGKRSSIKNYRPVSLLSVAGKVFQKLVNNRIVDHLEKFGFFSDFQYSFRSSQSTAYLLTVVSDRNDTAFKGHLIYPRLSTKFGMLVFFTNLDLLELQVRYLALFLFFSVIGGFGCFWMGNLYKNIQFMLEFLKGPFLVLHCSYCLLMIFQMILYVILLSMLMVLHSNQNMVSHLICGNN